MDRKKITPDILHELLVCDADKGLLFWRARPIAEGAERRGAATWNVRFAGKPALDCVDKGYKVGNILGNRFKAHRVIWAMSYGTIPRQIDHINGNGLDNRLQNLREATQSQNMANTALKRKASGLPRGVRSLKNRFQARVKHKEINYYLGSFASPQEAEQAYLEKSLELHGQFHHSLR